MGRFICCWRTMADDNEVAEEAEEAYAEELREATQTQTRCPASLTPRSPCLTSMRSSPRPSHLRLSPAVVSFSNPFATEAENLYCAAAASFRTSPLSFRTSPSPTSNYLRIDDGTSPTSSRLMAHSPNPCSSILHLSGLLDPSLTEKTPAQEEVEVGPRTPLPHHTCSLCSLIRRHDRASPVSSGSLASRVQRDVGRGNFSAAAPSSTDEEEEGHCKCTEEDNQSPPPSPTSPPSVRARPVLAPYFPPSPPVQEIGEGSSLKADNLQASVDKVSDPVEYQFLTVKRTLDTLLQKRRSPSAMVRASHASLSFPERLI